MKIVKRLLIGTGILLVVLFAAALSVPYLFKDKLTSIAKSQINQNLRAEVDFTDLDVSFFRSFPRLNLRVDSFSVVGVDTFAGLPLARGASADFALDLMSVIRNDGNIRIRSIELHQPEINILVLPTGLANYDVAIVAEEEQPDTSQSELNFALDEYTITDGRLVYDDRSTETYIQLRGLDHSGTGNFTLDVFDLDTHSEADSLVFAQGGITYISNARATLDALLNIDLPQSKYTLKDNLLHLNELALRFDGYVALPNETDVVMDFTFTAPENDFKDLWSIIPAAYTQGYENVQATGEFKLAGNVKGTYRAEPEAYPSFSIQSQVSDGNVKYPDLPLGIQQINADININSPTADLNDMVIQVPQLALRVGDDPFRARLGLRTPISDPNVDAEVDGVIDLAQWARAFPMEGVDELTGRIVADVSVQTSASAIEQQAYDRVKMDGELSATNINYRAAGLPPVRIAQVVASFNPQNVVIRQFNATLGRSDLSAEGTIDNILAYISPEKTMRGNLVVASNYFDANEWLTEETPPTAKATPAELAAAEVAAPAETEIFDRFDFTIDSRAKEIVYDTYKLQDTRLAGRIQPNRIRIDEMATTLGQTRLSGTGTVLNAFDYTFENGILAGQLAIVSSFINLNDFMPADEAAAVASSGTAADESLEPIPVPKNINMKVSLDADRVQYTDILLNQVGGDLLIRDGQALIENGRANTLGGAVNFTGGYDTSDPQDPRFSFKYDLKDIDFAQAYQNLNTFKALAPISKFIEGKFSSNMVISGQLGKGMFPILSSIDAEGFLQTLNAAVSGFKPLNEIGRLLNVPEMQKALRLNNVKSWFTVNDGTVEVKPFDFRLAQAQMVASGSHGLNQQMNYNILAAIPRRMLEGNFVGAAVGRGVDQLLGQARKLGLNIQQSDTVNVKINLAGTITDPKIGFNLLGTDGKAGDGSIVGAGEEALKGEAAALKETVKEQVGAGRETVGRAVDSVKTTARQELESAKQDAKDRIKDVLTGGSTKPPAKDSINMRRNPQDSLKQGVQQGVDSIRANLDRFNPFKKKKSGGGR